MIQGENLTSLIDRSQRINSQSRCEHRIGTRSINYDNPCVSNEGDTKSRALSELQYGAVLSNVELDITATVTSLQLPLVRASKANLP